MDKPTTEQLKQGWEAKYKGEWAYIVHIYEDGHIMLSGWRGIKTSVVQVKQITDYRPMVKK